MGGEGGNLVYACARGYTVVVPLVLVSCVSLVHDVGL